MDDANCINCDWYAGDDIRGTCHRRAPIAYIVNHPHDIVQTKWPDVFANSWCGDFKEKQGESEPKA